MSLRTRRKELHGLVGGLGVVAFLGGLFGGLYSIPFAMFLALAIWILGATLVNLLTDRP